MKAAIPTVRTGNPEMDRFVDSVKQNLDAITAQARNVPRLSPLPDNATNAEIIARLNALLERIQ